MNCQDRNLQKENSNLVTKWLIVEIFKESFPLSKNRFYLIPSRKISILQFKYYEIKVGNTFE